MGSRTVVTRARWSALSLLCVAQFADVLDVNVVIVALPAIGRDLGFSQENLQWVVSAYVVVFAGSLLLAGRMADLFGRRRMFMVGLALFTLSSLICGLANSQLVLVSFRAVQGLGAAITAPAALSIITTTFSENRERNFALGIWTAVAAGGGATGLVLGGLITDGLGWEWVFFINVPIGVASLALAPVLLSESRVVASQQLDVSGALSITAGLVLLIYGLTRAEDAGFGSPITVGAFVLAAALIATFLFIEHRIENPLIPLGVFRSHKLVGASIVAFTNTATTSPAGVLLAIYLQSVLGYSPTFTGLTFLLFSLSVIAGSFVGPWLTAHVGVRPTIISGLLSIAVAALLTTGITAEGGLFYVLLSSLPSGLGLGCSAFASTAVGTSALGQEEQGLASGLLNTAAQIGTALGLAVLVTVAAARTETLTVAGEPAAWALVEGYRWAFFTSTALAVIGAFVALFTIRERKNPLFHTAGGVTRGKDK